MNRQKRMTSFSTDEKGVVTVWDDRKEVFIRFPKSRPKRVRILEDQLNYEQNLALYRLMHGLSCLPKKVIEHMDKRERRQVERRRIAALKSINRLKNEVLDLAVQRDMCCLFKNSELAKKFSEPCPFAYDMPNRMSVRDLGITRMMIAKRLVRDGLLDSNLFEDRPNQHFQQGPASQQPRPK